ncbi:hypothetical protein [Marinobacter sp. F3R08]|uniref:hypothetical protein n=1 Tax=Marinobacter sp. F3R08 TaxID=2841559 RepID=UPI001C08012D|nr:hypothetical protein [Marinobacter sp. F3R08]MBU2953161.1 hypothetical protein [Marinobacter sp. F3R08]
MGKARQVLANLCAYTHLWQVIRERRLPSSARPGFSIALLGLLCPFFWIALLSGASKAELIFHGSHSGLVFCAGVFLMLRGLRQHRNLPE